MLLLERLHLVTSPRICGRWVMGKKSRYIPGSVLAALTVFSISIFNVSPRARAMKSGYFLRSQISLENK